MFTRNILHLVPMFNTGGVEATIRLLIRRGAARSEFVASSGGTGLRTLEALGIPWRRAPLYPSTVPNVVRAYVVLRRLVRDEQIGLIHSHHRFCSFVGHAVAYSAGIPFVCTVHDLANRNRLLTRLGAASTVLVFSEAVERHLASVFGLRPANIFRIPMGIDLERAGTMRQHQAIRVPQPGPRRPVVAFYGRLEFEKGPDVFAHAIPKVLAALPNTHFWYIGDGSMRAELEALVGRMQLAEQVQFLGWHDNPAPVLSGADLVVVPSRSEGFGRAALEALVLKKPVIASRVGGLPEIVRDGIDGLLTPPGDPFQLAAAIESLLQDENIDTWLERRQGGYGHEMCSVADMQDAVERRYEEAATEHLG